jgi:hypothetical protein
MHTNTLLIMGLAALVGALVFLWRYRTIRTAEHASVPSEAQKPPELPAALPDIEPILALSARYGWTCEQQPSPALWYRLHGKTEQGLSWDLIQGLPTKQSERRNRGLRWSTNGVRIRHLCLEIFPKHVYTRMKSTRFAHAKTGNENRSMDSLKMVYEIPPISFRNSTLNERFTLITIAPTIATLLFTDDVEAALLHLGTASVRVSLGFPNLRISVMQQDIDSETVKRVVDFGALFAERYVLLNAAIDPEGASAPQ